MRHFYKSHGKHCYLRSFQTSCPKCGADVLYWECTHGSKLFFQYPPYGKLIRHFCRGRDGVIRTKNKYPVIVKKPKGLIEPAFLSCPICGKLFKNNESLKDHLNESKKHDLNHSSFEHNQFYFGEKLQAKNQTQFQEKDNYKPKFGRINIKPNKNDD